MLDDENNINTCKKLVDSLQMLTKSFMSFL